MSSEKKERVIHTRVPESLDDEIKRKANDLGLSVSNLVRNILQNTFGLVESIVHDSAEIARSARGEGARWRGAFDPGSEGDAAAREMPGPAAPATSETATRPPRVLGWHIAILNVNAVCDACNAILLRGSRAAIGIVEGGAGPTPFRCLPCAKELSDHEPTTDE